MPTGFALPPARRRPRRRRRDLDERQQGSSTGAAGAIAIRPRAIWRIACAGGVVGVLDHERHAAVGVLAQGHRQRHPAEQRHVELVGELLAAALAEDREALARWGW